MAVVQLLLQEHADVSICREVCTLTVIAACKYSGAGEGLRILGIFCALLYTTLGVYMRPPQARRKHLENGPANDPGKGGSRTSRYLVPCVGLATTASTIYTSCARQTYDGKEGGAIGESRTSR